jgi:hypothetical protein
MTKPWFKSRNFWAGLALAVCGVVLEAAGESMPAWLVAGVGAVQMWLRATTQGVPLQFRPKPVDVSEG